MGREEIVITRGQQKIQLLREHFDQVYDSKGYITINKINRSYGRYYQVMCCWKDRGRIAKRTSLARVILRAPKNIHVDHIDRNPLNNLPENLRLSNPSSNGANRRKAAGTKCKYKGVSSKGDRYYATCTRGGKRYSVSNFKTEKEAARAYDDLAKMLHGDYAGLNFPEEG